jgi:hypothetical protein
MAAGTILRKVPADRGKINGFHQSGENMIALKTDKNLEQINRKPKPSGKLPKAKFGFFGEEMIEKEVKPAGNSGRVYLPLDWVGKHVKIIRID